MSDTKNIEMPMKTANLKFLQLCDEIDDWKQEAQYWQSEYEELDKKYTKLLNDAVDGSRQVMAGMVGLVLSGKINLESKEK